jgi:hypothetical protein
MATIVHLQLRVWRPCRWEREYLDVNKQRPAEVASFQECIYSWEPFSNLLDSITHTEQTETLGEVLENFAPTHSPEKRKVEKLKMVIEALDNIIKDKDGSNWIDSQRELKQSPEGESLNLREHPLLALRQHIQWVYDTFKSIPHVNVTFR